MEKQEKILLGLLAVALVALVIFRVRPDLAPDVTPNMASTTPARAGAVSQGPEYLTYNQPYAFGPPVYNALPQITAGQAGQSAGMTPSPVAPNMAVDPGCGCG